MYYSAGYLFNDNHNTNHTEHLPCEDCAKSSIYANSFIPHINLLACNISPIFLSEEVEAQKIMQIANDGADIWAWHSWL